MQIRISSMGVRNPPTLLPPGSVCLPSICPDCRCRSQSLPGVSRKQRYNTLDFPAENRVPTGVLLAPIGNPEPRGWSPLDTLLFSLKWCSHRKTAFSHVRPFFRKCHSTCSLFLLEHCKNFKLCRDVTSKNSVFSHIGIRSRQDLCANLFAGSG